MVDLPDKCINGVEQNDKPGEMSNLHCGGDPLDEGVTAHWNCRELHKNKGGGPAIEAMGSRPMGGARIEPRKR